MLEGLAVNPMAPVEVQLKIAGAAPLALLGREHLPPQVADVLARNGDIAVRRRLAGHPSTPDALRHALACDAAPDVRAEVAAWPSSVIDLPWPHCREAEPLAFEVYQGLAADPEPAVRAALGRNRHAPQAVRALLADDADPEVRRCAGLYDLPIAVLLRLLGDEVHAVRQSALMSFSVYAPEATFPLRLAELFQGDAFYGGSVIEQVELTDDLFERLWENPDLRHLLASNPSLPPDRMHALISDPELRAAVASNPCLPATLLEELVATEDPEVHRELLRRMDLPDALRRRLVAAGEEEEPLPTVSSLLPSQASLGERLSYLDHPNPAFRRTLALADDLPGEAVRKLAVDPDFDTRLLICERYTDVPPESVAEIADRHRGHNRLEVLRHPRLPVETLPGHAARDVPVEREAVASRPDLPESLVLQLLSDPVGSVRQAAAASPSLPADRLDQLLTDADRYLREGAASNPGLPVARMRRLLNL